MGTCRHCLGLDFWWISDTRLAIKVLYLLDSPWIQKMPSLLSVHSVQFSKGISNSSETFLVNLRPNTAAMRSNLGTYVTFVGATFAFAAINRTVTSPSSYVWRTVIECLILNSYFFYADFFCINFFFFVGRGCVTFIVVVCNLVFITKLIL